MSAFNAAASSVDKLGSLFAKHGAKVPSAFAWIPKYVADFQATKANVAAKPDSYNFDADFTTGKTYAEQAPKQLKTFEEALAKLGLTGDNTMLYVGLGVAAIAALLVFPGRE